MGERRPDVWFVRSWLSMAPCCLEGWLVTLGTVAASLGGVGLLVLFSRIGLEPMWGIACVVAGNGVALYLTALSFVHSAPPDWREVDEQARFRDILRDSP